MGKLTELQLKALTSADDGKRISDDGSLFGLVRAKSGNSVSVSFSWRYRFNGKLKDLRCGTWPRDRLSTIRSTRQQARGLLDSGNDPSLHRKALRLEQQLCQKNKISNLRERLGRVTVSDLFERWLGLDLSRRKDGGREVIRAFNKDVLPVIGDMAAEDVNKADITQVLDRILLRGANRLASRTLAELRQMFGFAFTRDIVKADPTHGIRKKDIGGKQLERDRVLNEDEIRELAAKIPEARLSRETEHAIWIMLSTACRVGEISRARWEHVDFERKTWNIPSEHSKNGRALTVYLSEFALSHFLGLQSLAAASAEWIFPARTGASHVSDKSLAKQIGDRQRLTGLKNRSKLTGSLLLSRGPWTPHDLRRTAATLMGGVLRIPSDVVERCLNHTEQNRIKRTDQRQELREEQAQAWTALGGLLESLSL